jgi:hypothetical protein
MIDNDLVQAALVAKFNSTPNIQTSLPSGTILEYDFQGADWTYPNGRLHVENQYDVSEDMTHCPSYVEFSFYAFSEHGTSKQANQIASKFVNSFRGVSFTVNNIKFARIKILENIPAIKADERTWRAQVRCRSLVHNA